MHELDKCLRADLRKMGDFHRVHPMPVSSADVPDDLDARLVVLGVDHAYSTLLTWQQDAFAYAESYDESAARYRGLRSAAQITVTANDAGLLVRPDAAKGKSIRRRVLVYRWTRTLAMENQTAAGQRPR